MGTALATARLGTVPYTEPIRDWGPIVPDL